MKKFLFPILLLAGCSPVYLIDKTEVSTIPLGAKKVVVYADYSADSLFSNIEKTFVKEGWQVSSNKSVMQVSAAGKSIGRGTLLKPIAYVESKGTGSVGYLTGEWGADADGQLMLQAASGGMNTSSTQPIVWEGKANNKPDLCFQQLILFAKGIPKTTISYQK